MNRRWILLAATALTATLVAGCSDSDSGGGGGASGPTKVKESDYKSLPGGLKYAVLKPGSGAEAKPGQAVSVQYTGWLQSNGQKFDSSYDNGGDPFQFRLGSGMVIKGWDEGVAGMKVGEKRQLVIPPELGYGAQGAGGKIPPNSTLVFDVELIDTK